MRVSGLCLPCCSAGARREHHLTVRAEMAQTHTGTPTMRHSREMVILLSLAGRQPPWPRSLPSLHQRLQSLAAIKAAGARPLRSLLYGTSLMVLAGLPGRLADTCSPSSSGHVPQVPRQVPDHDVRHGCLRPRGQRSPRAQEGRPRRLDSLPGRARPPRASPSGSTPSIRASKRKTSRM